MKKNEKSNRNKTSVTREDVARAAGVSTTVVSYVVNNGPRPVAEDTRARVLKAIEELGYRPNKHAQSLNTPSGQATRQIGIVMGGGGESLLRPYYADILYGIYDEAYRQDQRIRFLHFFDELHDPVLFNEHVHREEISALIIFPPDPSSSNPQDRVLLDRMLARIKNVVCLERSVASVPSVLFDRAEAARTAMNHLIALGHRRIAYIGGLTDERLEGYRQTLLLHGVPYHDELVRTTRYSLEGAYTQALSLCRLDHPPTAIFAISDETAFGAMRALHEHHLRIPEDMALVSIDDIEFAAYSQPPLTTVRVPRRQMGMYALHVLAMHEAHPDVQPVSMVFPTELIVRDSCGART
jgi:DNA-binding LacI/PurR family transcriptional regulator